MTLAYSYIRMSRSEQLKGGSLGRQLKETRAYAAEHGLELDETVQDLGVSAFDGDNWRQGALGKFLELIKSDRVPRGSVLIVESLDRISREDPFEALEPFRELVRAGIKIVTLFDGQEYDREQLRNEPWRLMSAIMVMMRAHDESRMKSKRIGDKWKWKHENAGPKMIVTARCPGWLEVIKDANGRRVGFKKRPEKVAAIRRAFEMTANGMGRNAVAKMLNASGATSTGGGIWHTASLARLLWDNAVLGVYQPHAVKAGVRTPRGEPKQDYYPAIVSPELVERARAAIAERRTGYAGRRGTQHGNVFSGIVLCACGAKMKIRSHGKRRKSGDTGRSLVCTAVDHGGKHLNARSKSPNRHFNYARFEAAFLDHVKELDLGQFERQQDDALQALDKEIATVSLELAAKRKALKRYHEMFETGEDAAVGRIRELSVVIKDREEQERQLQEQRKHLNARKASGEEHIATIERLRKKMAAADGDELYRIRAQLAQEIRRIVENISFDSQRGDGKAYVTVRSLIGYLDDEPCYALVNYWMTDTGKSWAVERDGIDLEVTGGRTH